MRPIFKHGKPTSRAMSMIVLALFLAGIYALRSHVNRAEVYRAEMDRQRELTRSLIHDAIVERVNLNPSGLDSRSVITSDPHTWEWCEILLPFEENKTLGAPRARISGGSGGFGLKTITIEIFDPSLKPALLTPLLRAYEERNWKYQVIAQPVISLIGCVTESVTHPIRWRT